jgi:hypothetical protein
MRTLIDFMQKHKHTLVLNIFKETNFKLKEEFNNDEPKPDQNVMISSIIEEKFAALVKM